MTENSQQGFYIAFVVCNFSVIVEYFQRYFMEKITDLYHGLLNILGLVL